MSLEMLREFFGWCTVFSFGLLFISSIMLFLCRAWAAKIHARMFDLDEAWLRQAYFQYLASFKIAVIVFNLVPYVALRMMGGG